MPLLVDWVKETAKESQMQRILLNSYTSLKALSPVFLQAAFPALLRVLLDLAWTTAALAPSPTLRPRAEVLIAKQTL